MPHPGAARRDLICIFSFGENYGVAAIKLAASNAPPERCI